MGGYAVDAYQPVWEQHREAFAPTYAGFWIRLGAYLLDSLIVGFVVLAIFIGILLVTLAASWATGTTPTGGGSTADTVWNLIRLVLYVGYFVYFWGMGQTPAMRWLGLQVVDSTTGAPIGFGRAILRYVGYVLSVLVCYVGLIWAAFDPRKQGWHDKIARTVVIQAA